MTAERQTISTSSKCERCGGQNHLFKECPAREQTCFNCNRTGHFSSTCRSKPSQRTAALHLNEVQIKAIDGNKNKLQVSIVTDNGFKTKVKALPDTGADISVMGAGIFNKTGISKRVQLGPCLNQELLAVGNTPLAQAGTFNATIRVAGQEAKDITVVVCSEVKDFYLGLDVCKSLNIVGKNFPCPMTTKVAKIECEKKPSVKTSEAPEVWPDRQEWILTLPEEAPGPEIMKMVEDKLHEIYAEIFNDSEELKPMTGHEVGEPMRITLKPDAKPFAVNAPRQIPYALRDKVKEALQYMVERGIIEKLGDVPTEWCHPIVIVPKPGGDIRMCVDLTKLNSQVHRTSYHTNACRGRLPRRSQVSAKTTSSSRNSILSRDTGRCRCIQIHKT